MAKLNLNDQPLRIFNNVNSIVIKRFLNFQNKIESMDSS